MTDLTCLIAIPKPFLDEIEALYWQSFTRDLYNDVPTNREIVMITVTEEELATVLTDYPQIQVLEKHQLNGLRAGLTRVYDEDLEKYIIEGSHNYNHGKSVVAAALKPKPIFDSEGNQTGAIPRVLEDDDNLRLAGWQPRNYTD